MLNVIEDLSFMTETECNDHYIFNRNIIIGVSTEINHGLRDDLTILRRHEDNLDRGVWDRPIYLPNWDKIINLCLVELQKSCDPIIAIRLVEALTHKYDFFGLKCGLEIMQKVFEQNEKSVSLFKEEKNTIDEWINNKLPYCIYKSPVIQVILKKNQVSENLMNFFQENLKEIQILSENMGYSIMYYEIEKAFFKIKALFKQSVKETPLKEPEIIKQEVLANDNKYKKIINLLNDIIIENPNDVIAKTLLNILEISKVNESIHDKIKNE